MTQFGKSRWLKHLGTLRGSGNLSVDASRTNLGSVSFEIDGYRDRTMRTANGQIEGDASALAQAFQAGAATIALAGGASIAVVLSDPLGASVAQVQVTGPFPL